MIQTNKADDSLCLYVIAHKQQIEQSAHNMENKLGKIATMIGCQVKVIGGEAITRILNV